MKKRHGRKRFYIVGEGVYGERDEGDIDGKLLVRAAAADAAAGAEGAKFRFSRIAPAGKVADQLGATTRKSLAEVMTAPGGAPSTIPSGFTYLGQFIDHDLTSDKTGTPLGQDEPPATMLQGRSPALDLDSLYGDGPNDPGSEQFYKADLLHLKVGAAEGSPTTGFDLPRSGSTPGPADIPDPRNDENLAVAQTHLAFIRFHNRVVDTLPADTPQSVAFSRARKQVTRHYQWIIKTDFLPRICSQAVLDDVFTNGRKIFEVGVPPTQVPTMPIEFSVAAYRLGHSMVRAAYNWNAEFPNGAGTLPLLFNFSGTSGALSGASRLPSIWIADFRRLYDFSESGKTNLVVPAAQFNHAKLIDTKLADPLALLPQETIGPPPSPLTSPKHNLAFRNLTRAKMVRLPTGQDMVAFLATKGVNVTALTANQIRNGSGGATLPTAIAADVVANTPLWFYILREAELNNGRLHGVGARIVAETFHRAMEGSATSILRGPPFTPSEDLGSPDGITYRMVDMLFFAFEGKASLLNPNGPET
jgi:Animal haem peroxidase